jgi:VWFA-related protein
VSAFRPLAFAALASVGATAAGQQAQFRGSTDTVALYVTVTDPHGAHIDGLTKADFQVHDNGAPREIVAFGSGTQPITAVLLLDMRGSIQDVPWMQYAGEQLLTSLRPEDRLRIGTFGDEIALSPRLTGDRAYLTWVLREELWPGRQSPVWRAIDTAMTSIARETGRRDIIVLTNGEDTTMILDAMMKPWSTVPGRVEREGFVVHLVTFKEMHVDRRLRALARNSGGQQITIKDLAGAPDAFTTIARHLHAQYLIGFVPAAFDGKPHDIKVRVARPGAVAHTRQRYLAPAR